MAREVDGEDAPVDRESGRHREPVQVRTAQPVHEHDWRTGAPEVGIMDGALQIDGAVLHRRSFARLPGGDESLLALLYLWIAPGKASAPSARR
jgi:hypothetical protein